jgi:hypothetical protein
MMDKIKPYIAPALVAIVVIAIVFRVASLKKVVVGS